MKFTVTENWQQLPFSTGTLYIPRGVICMATGFTAPSQTAMGIPVTENSKTFYSTEKVWVKNGNSGNLEIEIENFM